MDKGQQNIQKKSNNQTTQNASQEKQVPGLVKAIAVLSYIGAGILILSGILLAIFFGVLGTSTLFAGLLDTEGLAGLIFSLGVVGGIFFIGYGVLYIFVARGLWKAQNWARITLIIILTLGIGFSIYQLIVGDYNGILTIIVNGLVAGYLFFNKKVKQVFLNN